MIGRSFELNETVVDLSPAWMEALPRQAFPRPRKPWLTALTTLALLPLSGLVSYANAWVDGVAHEPPPVAVRTAPPAERKVMVLPAQGLHLDLSDALTEASRGASSSRAGTVAASAAKPSALGAGLEEAAERLQRNDPRVAATTNESRGSESISTTSIRIGAQVSSGTSSKAVARELELDGRDSAHVDASGSDLERAYVPQQLLKKVLSGLESQIRYCYEQALTSDPRLKGRVTADVTVVPSGRVEQVDTSGSSLTSSSVRSCVERVLLRSRFPAGSVRQAATITYYWDFNGR